MRQQQLATIFVEIADTLVDDFDVIEFLQLLADRSVSVVEVSAAGLLITDQRGALRVVAASTEETKLLELFQLQADEGPCLDCFHTGRPLMASSASPNRNRKLRDIAADIIANVSGATPQPRPSFKTHRADRPPHDESAD